MTTIHSKVPILSASLQRFSFSTVNTLIFREEKCIVLEAFLF